MSKAVKKQKDGKPFSYLGFDFQPMGETATDTRHLRMKSPVSGAEWKAYRMHWIDAGLGASGACYLVKDLRGWDVGKANTLNGLCYLMAKSDKDMAELFVEEDMAYRRHKETD